MKRRDILKAIPAGAAAKYPYQHDFETRGNDRMLDGTIVRP